MPILRCYVDDQTMSILEEFARRSGRNIEELAECAIAEEALRSLPPHLRIQRGYPISGTRQPIDGD